MEQNSTKSKSETTYFSTTKGKDTNYNRQDRESHTQQNVRSPATNYGAKLHKKQIWNNLIFNYKRQRHKLQQTRPGKPHTTKREVTSHKLWSKTPQKANRGQTAFQLEPQNPSTEITNKTKITKQNKTKQNDSIIINTPA